MSAARTLVCGEQQLDLSKPHVMGVLNVTPDSFSDGGHFVSMDMAVEHALRMEDAGATFIDVGGESTRPGADPVSLEQELARTIPVIEAVAARTDCLVSIDSSTPQVFLEAAQAGAHLINDVRALQREGALQAAAQTGLPVCLMHMQGEPKHMQDNPSYTDVIDDVIAFLKQRIAACDSAGIAAGKVLVDPGFGFGKTLVQNLQLLHYLDRFHVLNKPLLVGMSRKSMVGTITGKPVSQRLSGSLALAVMAYERGASIIRVHDVEETVDALKVVSAALAAGKQR
ncbi:MAG: dihydropteroate synthase [Gammaproteobacteria bacterium]|nr:MAG: dihydropteroate synthase [Gammaproteobacteria bacterium]